MPCVHMCSVINDINHYTPELFHIRWWKHYHFFYKRETEGQKNENIVKDMKSTLLNIRESHFCHKTGKYRGVPLEGTPFLQSLNTEFNFELDGFNDKTYQIMKAILRMEELKKPLVNGSKAYCQYMTVHSTTLNKDNNDQTNVDLDNYEAELSLCNDENTNNCNGMGAGSEMLSQLSDFREECANHSTTAKDTTSCNEDSLQVYDTLKPMFYSLMNKIKTEKQLLEAVDAFEKLTFKFTNEPSKKRKSNNDEDNMTFLGECNGPRVKESRVRYHYEKKRSK